MNKEYDLTDTTDYSKLTPASLPDVLKQVDAPEPFHLIMPHELYYAIKNNSYYAGNSKVDRQTAEEFEKFKKLFKAFLEQLNRQDPSAFSILSTIMTMWGYSRKYCGMCGKPIIGRPGHIENRMVCSQCNASYRITEKLYQKDETPYPPKKFIPKRYPGNSQNPVTKEQSDADKR